MVQSQFLNSAFAPPSSGTATFPATNSRTRNDSGVQESHFLDSSFAPHTGGSPTFPAANSQTQNDSGVQESHFLSESPPLYQVQQAAMATQPRWTPGAAPALRRVHELFSDSESDGTTTYRGSRSSTADSDTTPQQQRQSKDQPWDYLQGAAQTQNQERQRHMRLWSSSVASENRPSTSDSDSTA